jgi:hypothetical protein
MSMRHKHLAEIAVSQGPRRRARPLSTREVAVPGAFGVFAAAARLVERATRRR